MEWCEFLACVIGTTIMKSFMGAKGNLAEREQKENRKPARTPFLQPLASLT